MLLTNSGNLSRYLELPKNSFAREYKVKVKGEIDIQKLKKLKKGIVIKGIKYKRISVNVLEKNKNFFWLKMKLTEGKNREIRKIINFFGWRVNRLQRISYGPIRLNKLKKNEISFNVVNWFNDDFKPCSTCLNV